MRIRIPRHHKHPVSLWAVAVVVVICGPAWAFLAVVTWGVVPDETVVGILGGLALAGHITSVVMSASRGITARVRTLTLLVAAPASIITWLAIGAFLGSGALGVMSLVFAIAPLLLRPREVTTETPMPSLPGVL